MQTERETLLAAQRDVAAMREHTAELERLNSGSGFLGGASHAPGHDATGAAMDASRRAVAASLQASSQLQRPTLSERLDAHHGSGVAPPTLSGRAVVVPRLPASQVGYSLAPVGQSSARLLRPGSGRLAPLGGAPHQHQHQQQHHASSPRERGGGGAALRPKPLDEVLVDSMVSTLMAEERCRRDEAMAAVLATHASTPRAAKEWLRANGRGSGAAAASAASSGGVNNKLTIVPSVATAPRAADPSEYPVLGLKPPPHRAAAASPRVMAPPPTGVASPRGSTHAASSAQPAPLDAGALARQPSWQSSATATGMPAVDSLPWLESSPLRSRQASTELAVLANTTGDGDGGTASAIGVTSADAGSVEIQVRVFDGSVMPLARRFRPTETLRAVAYEALRRVSEAWTAKQRLRVPWRPPREKTVSLVLPYPRRVVPWDELQSTSIADARLGARATVILQLDKLPSAE